MPLFTPNAVRKGVVIQEAPYEAKKHLTRFVEEHYKCAQQELIIQPKPTKPKLTKDLAKIARIRKLHQRQSISPFHCLIIVFTIQASLIDVGKYMNNFARFDTWSVTGICIIIYLFIALPVQMVFYFLSNYTRFSYVKIWYGLPMLKGMAFAVAIMNLLSSVINMGLSALHFFFLIVSLSTNWLYCDFPGLSEMDLDEPCIPYKANVGPYCEHMNMSMPEFGPYLLVKATVNSQWGSPLNYYWITLVVLLYGIICLIVVFSRGVLTRVTRFVHIMWYLILVVFLTYGLAEHRKYSALPNSYRHVEYISDGVFWIYIGRDSLRRTLPGDLVMYASITKGGISPKIMALLLSICRIIFLISIANMYSISVNRFIRDFDIINYDCLDLSSLSVLFYIVPSYLRSIHITTVILYFVAMVYLGMMSSYYSIVAFITSITDDNPDSKDYKMTISALLILIMCALTTSIIAWGFEFLVVQDSKVFLAPFMVYVGVGVFLIIYSPLRIANDYYYVYNEQLGSFWYSSIKAYVIFIGAIMLFFVIFECYKLSKTILISNMVLFFICVTPVILIVVTHFTQAKKKKGSLFGPDSRWGPPDNKRRLGRYSFNPKRECRFVIGGTCKHNCIMKSDIAMKFLQDRIRLFELRKTKFVADLRMHHTELEEETPGNN